MSIDIFQTIQMPTCEYLMVVFVIGTLCIVNICTNKETFKTVRVSSYVGRGGLAKSSYNFYSG